MTFKSRCLSIAILILLLIVSCLFIGPKKKEARLQFHSSQLREIVSVDGNTKRTDYVDSDGHITIAADKRYATVIVTEVSENSKMEQYYDDHGKPISRYNGYYGVLRDYDEKGNNIRITYLDYDGKPMIMANGYAIEEREYNDRKQEISERYYDTEGKPILTPLYGSGKITEYNRNGKISRITYINISGTPTVTKNGYAIISRNYNLSEGTENRSAEIEFYFDEEGNPVKLSLGEYGLIKEFDSLGRNNKITYLDAAGNKIITNKGYTSVIRTFQANNTVATEQYFDINGVPFSLPEGQYGLKSTDNRVVYLDENGNEQFNLKNLLYNSPPIIPIAAMAIVLLTIVSNKNWNIVFLFGYIIAIAYLTIMFRETDGATLKLDPFWSYRKILTDSETRADILKNIWLFIPLGAILYRICPHARILLVSVGLSILIEAIQYFAGIGFCELDDVISNGLGGVIGYGMGSQAKNIRDLFLNEKHKRIRTAKD